MRIPQVRSELLEIAAYLEQMGHGPVARRIRQLVVELHRRKPVTRHAPHRQTPPKAVVLSAVAANPHLDWCGVAELLGTNPGRISEKVAGKRT